MIVVMTMMMALMIKIGMMTIAVAVETFAIDRGQHAKREPHKRKIEIFCYFFRRGRPVSEETRC